MKNLSDQKIINSWNKNVDPWIEAINDGQIKSRTQLTNAAIIKAVTETNPSSVLDIGCGEGWLVRALHQHGINAFGIDVVPEFIRHANNISEGRFKCIAYEDLLETTFEETFDLLVCNFSLLGKESVEQVFKSAARFLKKDGLLIVQTIHPISSCGKKPYQDGWRTSSWDGFNDKFQDPAPWYFRTMESWKLLFIENGFTINKIIEPKYNEKGEAVSVIFVGVVE